MVNLNYSKVITSFNVNPEYELRSQKIGSQIPMVHYYFLLRNNKIVDILSTGREYCPATVKAWLRRNNAT